MGTDRWLQLLISGPGIETTEIVADTDAAEDLRIEADGRSEEPAQTVFASGLLHVAGPSKPVEGRVYDLDTDQPIAGAVVRAVVVHGRRLSSSRKRQQFATRTDANGRYRLEGLPVGDGSRLVAFTPTGEVAYVPVGRKVDTTEASDEIDLGLRRGVWAEGRVYDTETDEPFLGNIEYYHFRNDPVYERYPDTRRVFPDGLYPTDADGRFRLPVLPTRGVLAFQFDHSSVRPGTKSGIDRFPRGGNAAQIEGYDAESGFLRTEPYMLIAANCNGLNEVNPAADAESVRVDMAMSANAPVRVWVAEHEGSRSPASRPMVPRTAGAGRRSRARRSR